MSVLRFVNVSRKTFLIFIYIAFVVNYISYHRLAVYNKDTLATPASHVTINDIVGFGPFQ